MKRWLLSLLVLTVCISFSACGDKEENMTITSFRNAETGVTISLGMAQEEVEGLLGEGTYLKPKSPFTDSDDETYEEITDEEANIPVYSYGDGKDFIVVTYEDGVTVAIFTSHIYANVDVGPTNWYIKHQLTYGSAAETVFEKLGKKEEFFFGSAEEGTRGSLVEYYFDASGKRMDKYLHSTYLIMVVFDKDKKIGSIGMCDVTPDSSLLP